MAGLQVGVDLAAVAQVDHQNHEPAVINGVDHPVVAHPDAVCATQALQSDHAGRPRLRAERVDGGLHAAADPFIELGQGAQGIASDLDVVSIHRVL